MKRPPAASKGGFMLLQHVTLV